MALKKLVSLGKLAALPKGRAKLVVLPDGRRFACVRRTEGDAVDVLDDRCPHEGHPLSMGLVREGVLTCQWHNWKFDLATGACTAGGEAVRRYACEIYADEVFVDLDRTEEHFAADLARAIREGAIDAAVRVALRWGTAPAVDAIVAQLANGRPRGLLEAIPAIAAVPALNFSDAESLALIAQVASNELHGRGPRTWPSVVLSELDEAQSFLAELVEERRSDAIGRILGLPAEISAETIVARWLLPWTAAKLWDRGDALTRVAGVVELLPRITPATARMLVASLAESLAWSVADSDLPPWRATRNALLAAAAITPGTGTNAPSLDGNEPASVAAAVHALESGIAPVHVLSAIEHASIERLVRYDPKWSTRVGSTAIALDAGRPLSLARSAKLLLASKLASPGQSIGWTVQGAGLVGKLAARDGAPHTTSAALDALVRHRLLEHAPDESLARRVIVARALLEHADDPRTPAAMERALLDDCSLSRLAGNAARHVTTGEPPTEGD